MIGCTVFSIPAVYANSWCVLFSSSMASNWWHPFPAPIPPSDGRVLIGFDSRWAIFNWVSCWLDIHGFFPLPCSVNRGKWVEEKPLMPYSIQLLVVLWEMEEARKERERYSLWWLNPPDCGYINFSTLRLSETDVLQAHRGWSLYMETWMSSVVFRHERWLPSVVSELGKWRLQKLGASGKINKYSCHWGKQFSEILFYFLPNPTHQYAGYICLELASNVLSFISPFPIPHSWCCSSKMELNL